MTTGNASQTSLRRFAAQSLGLDSNANQSIWLRRLLDEDFVPDPVTHDAIRVLLGRDRTHAPWLVEAAALAEEQRLRGEVEQFAAGYFRLSTVDRRARWTSLATACAKSARLTDRLTELRLGLDVDIAALRDKSPLVMRLADGICNLFVMPAAARAAARRQRVTEIREDSLVSRKDLSHAVRRIRKQHPSLAALSPQFLSQLGRTPKDVKAWKAKFAFILHANWETNPGIAAVCTAVFMIIGITVGVQKSDRIASAIPQPRVPATPKTAPVLLVNRNDTVPFRNGLKRSIRSELARLKKPIDDSRLQQVVDALPPPGIPPVRGMATLMLMGHKKTIVEQAYAAAIRNQLTALGIVLDDAQLMQIVRACVI